MAIVLLADGLLGFRGSIMIDLVFLAMFAVVPILGYSIYLVSVKRNYQWHRRIQLSLGFVLAVAVTAFELEMRFVTDWRTLAAESPYFTSGQWCPAWISLVVHLCFAVPTTLLWVVVSVRAWRGFPRPAAPSPHSAAHRAWAVPAAAGMVGTAVTGWVFYWLAFAAA